MIKEWDALVKQHGHRCVLGLDIDDAMYDEVTAKQKDEIGPLLQVFAPRTNVLDYGCGAGRFTPWLGTMSQSRAVVGYDPCYSLITKSPGGAAYMSGPPEDFFARDLKFDFIFVWNVLGGLDDGRVVLTLLDLKHSLNKDGVTLIGEHTIQPPRPTWWRFRAIDTYKILFQELNFNSSVMGQCEQLQNPVTIFICHLND